MKTLVHLALWILLSIGLVLGIICSHCLYKTPDGICNHRRFRKCTLFIGQACYKQKVYFGMALLFTKEGCSPNCRSMEMPKEESELSKTMTCCSHRNYCNA